MVTALTVYGASNAATTLTGATNLLIVSGASNVGHNSLLNTATAYGEAVGLGTSSAWAALGSMPSTPTGLGFLLEHATLNLSGNTIAAGTWTATLRLMINGGTGGATADLYSRVYIYNGGVYTYQGTLTLAGQSIANGTSANYTLTGSLPAISFGASDLLYIDTWANVTANSGGSGANWRQNVSNTTTQGSTNNQWVTPGYAASVGGGARTLTGDSAALLATSARTISGGTTPLLLTQARTITPTTASVGAPNRAVPSSAALLLTRVRSMTGDTTPLLLTQARTISGGTTPLLLTQARTVPSSAALSGTAALSVVADGAVIRAVDINQLVAVLQRSVGSHAAGKYFLTGAAAATSGALGAYIPSLSRGVTPTGSVAIDTGDWPPTGCASPTADLLSASGFRVSTTASAAGTVLQVGGNYNITY